MRHGGALLATPGGPASGSPPESGERGRFGRGYAALGNIRIFEDEDDDEHEEECSISEFRLNCWS